MQFTYDISKKIVNRMIKEDIIPEEESAQYLYCFDFVSDLAGSVLFFLICGLLSGNLKLTVVFLLTLFPLKMTSGGAHASSRLMCDFISATVYIGCLVIVKNTIMIHMPIVLLIDILTAAIISIVMHAPVVPKHRKLSEKIRKKLQLFSGIVSITTGVACIVCYYYQYQDAAYMILCCIIITAINQYIGIIQRGMK